MAQANPRGYVQVTGLDSVATLGTIPPGTTTVVLQAESQPVRFRDDGEDPTSGAGMRLPADAMVEYTGDLGQLRFIEETATAKLNASFYSAPSGS